MGFYEDAEGVRRSDLWVINKTPMHFLYHMNHKDEKDSKPLRSVLRRTWLFLTPSST